MVTEDAGELLEGRGLHTGRLCRVALSARTGPAVFMVDDRQATLGELVVVRTDWGVSVRLGPSGPVVELVEHFMAALAAHGTRRGLGVRIEGGEFPLLDGGATRWSRALERLGLPRCEPDLVVTRPDELVHGQATYRFAPAGRAELAVTTEFDPPIGTQHAAWDGSLASFCEDIAPARTFGFARDAEALLGAGRARHVDLRSVMVFDEDGSVRAPAEPMRPSEVARHKLLDLMGDLALFGGPPLGRIEAFRPGHGATHAIATRALETGILARPFAPGGGRK